MRIRQLLIFGICLGFLLVTSRLIVLEMHSRQEARLDRIEIDAQRLSRDAAILLVVSQDHLIRPSSQTGGQWHAAHATLTRTLAVASREAADLRVDLSALEEVTKSLPDVIQRIELVNGPAGAMAQAHAERSELIGLLLSQTRRISDGAFGLAERFTEARVEHERTTRRVTWTTMMVIVGFVLAMSYLVSRRVLGPMAGLQRAAFAVRSGDLGARSNYRSADEFGSLSRTFDDMAQSLQERTATLAAVVRENEALLSTIRLHALFSVADLAGNIIDVNDNFCRITGYSRDELIGQNHRIVNSGVQGREFWTAMWATISSGKPWRGEVCNRAKDGSLYWVDSIIAPFIGAQGQIEKYISIRTDITAAKQTAQVLQKANERFAIASDAAGLGVWDLDLSTNTLALTEGMYRLFKRPRLGDAEPVEAWIEAVHADDRGRISVALGKSAVGEGDFDEEFRIDWPDGQTRIMKATGRLTGGGSGAAYRLTGVNLDVTERKRAEVALQRTTSMLQAVLESASEVAIIAVTGDGTLTVFNRGAERLLGYTSEELLGRRHSIHDFQDPQELEAWADELGAQLGVRVAGPEALTHPAALGEAREWTFVRNDRSHVPVSLVVTAMLDESGAPLGYLGIAHDVTRQRQHEESLRLATQRARHANLAKSQFLANMSHEIRTPMNAVIGLSYLLEQTPLDHQQADYLGKIRLASKSLLALITDILDLSKVEAGQLTIERAPFQLRHLLKDVADVMRIHAEAKGIAFELIAPEDLPVALEGDVTRLGQILTNLCSNGIKFTERGSVTLQVSKLAQTPHAVTLRLTVRDTGIGIAPEAQGRIFAPFAQADTSTTRRFGGTGLGLYIVQRLVNLMDGKVKLASTPGAGSEFAVELPFGLASVQDLPSQPAALVPGQRGLPGVRVLVADDSEINLEVARRILELEGARVTLACNGQEAYELVRSGPRDFDVVLMDVQMPVLDGYKATRCIRSELGLTALPIIALTAGVLTSERQRATESGMVDFVSKPFDPRGLVQCIRRHLPSLPYLPPLPADPEAARSAQPWPQIEGIDSSDAASRLAGDTVLFRSMLKRLLKEFGGVQFSTAPPGAVDSDELSAHASRMHKLRGVAGLLGARAISRLATEAEAACRAGEAGRAAQFTTQLAAQLQALQHASAPLLDEPAAGPDADADADADAAAWDEDPTQGAQAIGDLSRLLREQSLSALDCFNAASAPLRRRLGKTAYAVLREHIENLRFSEAAAMLRGETAGSALATTS